MDPQKGVWRSTLTELTMTVTNIRKDGIVVQVERRAGIDRTSGEVKVVVNERTLKPEEWPAFAAPYRFDG